MDEITRDALRYHAWANQQLLDACGHLTAEQLALTAPGTYGSIASTLTHMLNAEHRYIARLKGQPRPAGDDQFPGVEALRPAFARSGDDLIAATERLDPGDTTEVDYDGEVAPLRKSMIVVQALHHGNDHRTHIGTILGYHSIAGPDIDVWMYGLDLHRDAKANPS